MQENNQTEKRKKESYEVKSFPIPFALPDLKENIIINTNSNTHPFQEQIINQAFKFHSEGNIQEAEKNYRYFIKRGFNDPRVFFNYGMILQDLGKLEEAELSYRKAIKINPNFENAYLNLGSILIDLGELKEAELLQQTAIKINPNFESAHYNLGNILKNLGKLKEAELSYRKAIKINPNFENAYLNLGNTLKSLGKSQEAFDSYLKSIEINPLNLNIYYSLTELLKDSDPSLFNQSKLKYILNILLENNNIPHKELFIAFEFLYRNELINDLIKFQSKLLKKDSFTLSMNEILIVNALKKMIFTSKRLEQILTKVRKYICDQIAQNRREMSYSQLQFITALGEQCFLNEYIYSLTEKENLYLNLIINRCLDGEINETNISILSCYFPLYKLLDRIPLLKSFNSSNQNFIELIKSQITEPLKEIELSKTIKMLGSIDDNISNKVKSQYEENPYPRWRYGNPFNDQKLSISQAINTEISPNSINQNIDNNKLNVLIAGCGTGNQILQSQRYKNAEVTGVDLSSSSLAYAQRKINELELNNVDLIQIDILKISLLEKKFDIIECSGVLHHMDDPSKGLRELLAVLKNNGFLKLGLYSELARKDIVEAKNYIHNKKLQANEDDIREFRKIVFRGEEPKINSLMKSSDFYTLSSCRDLCFHAQEHRFTIHNVQEILKSHELEFLGFLLPQSIKSLYKNYFPEDQKQTSLQNWAKFEEKYPNTFQAMYQFWVRNTDTSKP